MNLILSIFCFRHSYFICVEKNCKARLATEGDIHGPMENLKLKYHRIENHTHRSDASANIVSETMSTIRQEASKNPDRPAKQLFEEMTTKAMQSVSSTPEKLDLAKKLPTFRNARGQIYLKKREKRPTLPKTVDDVNLDLYPDLTLTEDGKPLHHRKTESGCVVITSDSMIDIMGNARSAGVDATYGTCPEPFYQVFHITATVEENTYLAATALMPNKLETTYYDVFETLREICEENGVELDFVYVHCDCENAVVNSLKKVFPATQIRLCRFHVVDAIRRNADEIGLRPMKKTHPDYNLFYNRIKQIFFFPIQFWPRLWKLLTNLLGSETSAHPMVQAFLAYLVSNQLCLLIILSINQTINHSIP